MVLYDYLFLVDFKKNEVKIRLFTIYFKERIRRFFVCIKLVRVWLLIGESFNELKFVICIEK